MSDPDELVELLRTGDPMRAEMLREMLRGEGITVATPGLEHRASLGVIGGFVEIIVQVPRRQLEEAKELLEALDAAPLAGLEVTDDDAHASRVNVDYRTSARGVSTLGGKRRRVVPIAAMFIPGGGHVYVSEWKSAALIALTELGALGLGLAGMPLVILLYPLALIADVAGGTWHCERLAGQASPRWPVRRFAPAIVAVLAAGWIALQMGPGAELFAGPRSTQVCTWAAACSDVGRARCLWDASAGRMEESLSRRCEECLRDARECDEAYACDGCWAP